MSIEGDAIYARKIVHNAAIQVARAAAVADGGVDEVKFYGAGEYNFGEYDKDLTPEDFRIEFISKNGSTFTVSSY